ncbi:MAG: voltage-gated chloride channel family protein [Proteobacteria bacterium]|nr:MAG: voltage-gated chloride channel family protein [Pseudomonadota bacterium]
MKNRLRRCFRWCLLSAAVGILAGASSSIFLISLDCATNVRLANVNLIWFLPIAGFVIGWTYHHFGKDVAAGNNLIIDEIHRPSKVIPLRMAPFILIGTVATHLFGGSAGREGTAVQMGATLGDQLSKVLKLIPDERKILLVAGAGAGFGSAIGTPLAGVIFGMEFLNIGKLKLFAWFECAVASYVAFFVTHLLKAPHSSYPLVHVGGYHPVEFLYVAASGVLFGLTAVVFIRATHLVEKIQTLVRYPPLRPVFGGLLLIALYKLEGSYRFAGLGIEQIQTALARPSEFNVPILKTGFTALTIGSGFKGGEFIPLVFIGTTLGSFLSQLLPVSCGILGAVGFASVFAGASNTPLACSIMAIELFGIEIAPYAVIGCFVSYHFSGHRGIYKAQRIHIKKHQKLSLQIRMIGNFLRRCFVRMAGTNTKK